MRAALLALTLIACGSSPLRRHAASISEAGVRDDVTIVLDTLEDLRRIGALSWDGWSALCAPLPRVEPDVWGEHVSDECTAARAARDRAIEIRDRLEEEGDTEALDAIDAAVREISPTDDECPSRGDEPIVVVAAAVRHLRALTPGSGYVGVDGIEGRCRVATLGEPIEIGPPLVEPECGCEAAIDGVMRGDVLPGIRRIPPPDPPPTAPPVTESTETTTYDFEDDLYFAPEDGPFASSPTVHVTICRTDWLWLAQLDGRWLVGQRLHGEH